MVAALPLLAASEWAATGQAATPSRADAMAACRASYGKKVTNVIINKDGTLTCQWQVVREMTHAEAWEACRKKFGMSIDPEMRSSRRPARIRSARSGTTIEMSRIMCPSMSVRYHPTSWTGRMMPMSVRSSFVGHAKAAASG